MVESGAGAAGATGDPAAWTDLARAAAPELAVQPRRLIENGWDSRVLHAVDGGGRPWIFRFPRRREVADEMGRERRLLRLLRGRLGIAVPEWRVDAMVDGQLVIGYPTLPGHPAAYEPEGTGDFRYVIPVPPPRAYARTLAAALVRLHTVEVATVAEVLATGAPTPRTIRDEHARLLRRCAATFSEGAALADRWESQLADDRLWDFAPTLRHGDVHPEHTMVDDSGVVTGIIDWTDSGLGDPAADFVDPRFAFGPRFGAQLLADYAAAGGTVDGRLAERVAILQSWGPAQAALFGLDHGRPEVVARALARLHRQAGRALSRREPSLR